MVVGVFAGGPEYKMLGDHDLNLIIFEIWKAPTKAETKVLFPFLSVTNTQISEALVGRPLVSGIDTMTVIY